MDNLRLTPSGRLELTGSSTMTDRISRRRARAFERGNGHGILHLVLHEAESPLSAQLAYWRGLGKQLLGEACQHSDPLALTELRIPAADGAWCATFAAGVPPMIGAELMSAARIEELWKDTGDALRAAIGNRDLASLLSKTKSQWHTVGRVCLHLAEHKTDARRPFAFLATYISGLTNDGTPRHIPLKNVMLEFRGKGARGKLLALLAPLSRAAEQSAFLRHQLESGHIHQPQAWTSSKAHDFLRDTSAYEQAGLLVRAPDWWTTRKVHPAVRVSLGEKKPATLGLSSLLDFDVRVCLDGQPLRDAELRQLLTAGKGLVHLRGRWVEVDADRLAAVLNHWREIDCLARSEGIPFSQAMRLLARAGLEEHSTHSEEDTKSWAEFVAGKWLRKRLQALRDPAGEKAYSGNAGLRTTLRPYQKSGWRWLESLRQLRLGGCLADDMGLGKTIQVLALLSHCRKRKLPGTDLLVLPASLIENWRIEIERFAPGLKALIAHPSHCPSRELEKLKHKTVLSHDLVLTSYATVKRLPWMHDIPWRHLILDEAQAIKNPGSAQTRQVKALQAEWRLALSGTPIENRMGDLWSIFDFLNPGLLGSAAAFKRFSKGLESGDQGYAPLRRLVQPYILRRLKTDKSVIQDLPDKTEVRASCLLSRRQAALYEQSVRELEKELSKVAGIKRRGLVLSYLMRFKQICNHPSQWLGDGEFEAKDSGKFGRLREICETIAMRQEKVLVFTQFKQITNALSCQLAETFGHEGFVLHGGTSVRKRQQLVQAFQEDEHRPYMVLSLKAGGSGLNLTAASHVVHFDRWWNPAVEDQATDRAFRIGQKRNVLVHKFVCQGTVEDRIDEMLTSKRSLSDAILKKGAEKALSEMGDDELLDFVALDVGRIFQR